MKKLIAIIVCKLVRFIGKLVKKGSSLPGQIALKIDNEILSKIELPKYVIAVSGSNGKTSTVEMIKAVLDAAGYKVAYNYEGSNQIEGVTTLLLDDCDLNGKCKSDVILLESDERYAKRSFKYITPTHYIITNIYRDQMTRNGNPEWIFNYLKDSVKDDTKLLINGDDPLVALLADGHKNTIYYQIDKFNKDNNIGVYDDGMYCPKCKSKMKYTYRHFGHVGSFKCSKCNFNHPKAKYHITNVNLAKANLTIDSKYKVSLALKSIYNAYNILATYSLCRELNIDGELISKVLSNYVLKNGRVTKLKFNNNEGVLLISKHENSVSYNQTLSVIKNDKQNVTVLVLVDAISRKYFTSETSWLWDIDFNQLNSKNVKRIVLAGAYANDLAQRFEYTSINSKLINIYSDIDEAVNYIKEKTNNYVYVVTCFSDMAKIYSRVEVIK